MTPRRILPVKSVVCSGCGLIHVATRVGAKCQECKRKIGRLKAAACRAKYPEAARAAVRAWKLANAETVRQHKRDYQEKNRAHRSFYQNCRRASQLLATPAWADMDSIKGMYELCGIFRRIGMNLHVDHVVPLRGKHVSGLHVAENLQLLYATDNLRKKNRTHEVPLSLR